MINRSVNFFVSLTDVLQLQDENSITSARVKISSALRKYLDQRNINQFEPYRYLSLLEDVKALYSDYMMFLFCTNVGPELTTNALIPFPDNGFGFSSPASSGDIENVGPSPDNVVKMEVGAMNEDSNSSNSFPTSNRR